MSRSKNYGLLFVFFLVVFVLASSHALGSGRGICKVSGVVKSVVMFKSGVANLDRGPRFVDLTLESVTVSAISGDGFCERVNVQDFQVVRTQGRNWKAGDKFERTLECRHAMGANGIVHSCHEKAVFKNP